MNSFLLRDRISIQPFAQTKRTAPSQNAHLVVVVSFLALYALPQSSDYVLVSSQSHAFPPRLSNNPIILLRWRARRWRIHITRVVAVVVAICSRRTLQLYVILTAVVIVALAVRRRGCCVGRLVRVIGLLVVLGGCVAGGSAAGGPACAAVGRVAHLSSASGGDAAGLCVSYWMREGVGCEG